jgi:hypothetical protein
MDSASLQDVFLLVFVEVFIVYEAAIVVRGKGSDRLSEI